jgi:long-chain acyl-CoA synthetase
VILGASGENIYPEDIESVINNFRGVIESLVLEKKGRLVAMVCLNMDDLEKIVQQVGAYVEELKIYVNQHVNKYSQIHSVIVVPVPFEKTPTMKIKRYLYS